MKKDKLRSHGCALIGPIAQDGNDFFGKQFADTHHIKYIYCQNDKEYIDNFGIYQEEHENNIITKLEDIEELIHYNTS